MAPAERIKLFLLEYVGVPLFKAWFSTIRVRVVNPENRRRVVSGKEPFVFATWHRAAIYFLYYLGSLHAMVMFSRSRDGEYIARFASRMGTVPVRGSSSRGGKEALREMVRHLEEGGLYCATVLDGPRGPAFKAKPGMVVLAQRTGVPLMPILWSCGKSITFKKTWDGTMIPKPFSEVAVMFGDPIEVPAGGPEVTEAYTRLVEERLNRMKEELDRMCGYAFPV